MKISITGLDNFLEKLQALEAKLDSYNKVDEDRWVSNEEFCKLLGVCSKTAQSYRDKGLIKFSQIGSKIFYNTSSINTFLKSHSRNTFRSRK